MEGFSVLVVLNVDASCCHGTGGGFSGIWQEIVVPVGAAAGAPSPCAGAKKDIRGVVKSAERWHGLVCSAGEGRLRLLWSKVV